VFQHHSHYFSGAEGIVEAKLIPILVKKLSLEVKEIKVCRYIFVIIYKLIFIKTTILTFYILKVKV